MTPANRPASRLTPSITWLALVLVIAMLATGGMLLVDKQSRSEEVAIQTTANREIQLLAALVTQDLQLGNHQEIDFLLKAWNLERPDVSLVRLTLGDDLVLSEYQRIPAAVRALTLKKSIDYAPTGRAVLTLGLDVSALNETRNALIWRLVRGLTLLAIILAVLIRLWLRQRTESIRLAVQSAALGQANTALHQEIAQRQKAEKERDRLGNIIEASTDFVSIADPEGRLLYLNRGGRAMTGRTEQALDTLRITDMHPPWATDIILGQGIPAAIRDGHWTGETALLNHRDGCEFPVSQVILTHCDAQGELLYLSTVMRDISERKQMEVALRQAHGKNQVVLQAIHDSLYMLDETGHLIWWNRRLEEITGLTPERLMGMAGVDFFAAEERRAVEQTIGKAFSQGYAELEAQLLTRDGPVPYHFNAVQIHDASGCVIGIAGVGRDISDRVQALQALHRNELALKQFNDSLELRVQERTAEAQKQGRRAELILSTAIDGFFSADRTGKIRDVNPAFCDMLGYTETELLQMIVPQIEANENPAEVAAHIETVVKRGHDLFVSKHRRKDGSLIDVEISVSLTALDGEDMFYAFARDITPRKIAEEALLSAKQEAERANAAKSEFLSRMSHELRTPLNAIIGFGQILESDSQQPLTEAQADNVHEMLHGGWHLLELVNEVLDLARIESGRLDVSLEPVAIAPLLEACVAQVKPLARQAAISVSLDLKAAASVQADYTRLKQVLLNLLSNAIKYNREGGTVRLSCHAAPLQRLRINVQDSGPGIPQESLPRLFQPFERLSSGFGGVEGTGIGLALAKKLVEAMHGEIGVDSVPGAGSTFWFELPLSAATPTLEEVQREPSSEAASTPATIHRQTKLLYIEDNPANLRLVHKILIRRQHIELLDASNGTDGLEIAQREQPALILLDIGLPGMDGFEVLRHLKEHDATRKIPVIAVTANAMPRDIERGKAAGFEAYFTKPLDVVRFLALIDRFLAPGKVRDA